MFPFTQIQRLNLWHELRLRASAAWLGITTAIWNLTLTFPLILAVRNCRRVKLDVIVEAGILAVVIIFAEHALNFGLWNLALCGTATTVGALRFACALEKVDNPKKADDLPTQLELITTFVEGYNILYISWLIYTNYELIAFILFNLPALYSVLSEVVEALHDPVVIRLLRDPAVIRALETPAVVRLLLDPVLRQFLCDPWVIQFLLDPAVTSTLSKPEVVEAIALLSDPDILTYASTIINGFIQARGVPTGTECMASVSTAMASQTCAASWAIVEYFRNLENGPMVARKQARASIQGNACYSEVAVQSYQLAHKRA